MDYPGKVITKTQVTPTQTSASGNWTLDDQAAAIKNNNWPVALVPNPISKSLRFNSADSAYLNRTPATATNRRTYTWSGWFKRCNPATTNTLFSAIVDGNNFFAIRLREEGDNGRLEILNYSAAYDMRIETTQVFRDVSAWYHLVVAIDTTQATSTNRVKLYLNGSQITALSTTTYPSQNFDTDVNNTNAHYVGSEGAGSYHNGYMTEINFIDGQALTPSSFGMTNPQTGQWIPLKYSGTYGTNGFYLNFKDATSTTTLGYDYSGNANNWTTNNFSVTAGVGNDSLTDVPTPWFAYNTTGDVGGVIRGNYCTLNPLDRTDSNTSVTNGNLTAQGYLYGGSDYRSVKGTIYQTEKFYFEATISNTGSSADWYGQIGIANSSFTCPLGTRVGGNANSWAFIIRGGSSDVAKLNNNSATQLAASLPSAGDVIMIACDPVNGKVWFGRNGTWYGSGDPAAGTNAAYTNVSSSVTPAAGMYYNLDVWNTNFGQRPFAYTPPTGFRSLCTTNLPATAIGFGLTNQGDDYFNANLYTGTGSAFTLTGVGFQPDFGWFKGRNASSAHWLHDVVRGANPGLSSNNTAAEDTTAGQLTAFASDGYSLPNDTAGYLNFSGRTMVVWSWKAGGTGVTNTAGTVTSTVSANTTAGFSVVTFTGTGANATVGHGLGVAPSMYIVKNRPFGGSWGVYHTSIGATNRLLLNGTNASTADSGFWNNTAPTSTVFSVGNDGAINRSGDSHVAYCFAAVPGYSAFGSYTGNGSTDGPFVYLGFRPRYIMFKRTDASGNNWVALDTARNTYNVTQNFLNPNASDAEGTGILVDYLSNGFKIRDTWAGWNASGGTIIYAAFAESPFQFSNAR